MKSISLRQSLGFSLGFARDMALDMAQRGGLISWTQPKENMTLESIQKRIVRGVGS